MLINIFEKFNARYGFTYGITEYFTHLVSATPLKKVIRPVLLRFHLVLLERFGCTRMLPIHSHLVYCIYTTHDNENF
jgi:hypothetical protein